mgnify:CR=1 FL=1
MKISQFALATCALLVSAGALAQAPADPPALTGNATLVSDYRFRGISQNNGKFSPAIQGGFDWSTDQGFYLGTWASNVNFSEGSIETDLYGGFKNKINDDYEIGRAHV